MFSILTYIFNKINSIFKTKPDLRFKLHFNSKTANVQDQEKTLLHTFKLDTEYDLYIVRDGEKKEVNYFKSEDYPGYKFFYGLPIFAEKELTLICDSSIMGETKTTFFAGNFINYEKFFSDIK